MPGPGSQSRFPSVPHGWYYAAPTPQVSQIVPVTVGQYHFALFRAFNRAPALLRARCPHMGADLCKGQVTGDRIECPLHGWAFDTIGTCVHIPASDQIPDFARVSAYPTVELAGHVLFFNAARPQYDFPFFERRQPQDLLPARPFDFVLETPWHMVGANAFDMQHFRIAHDRTLIDSPTISKPSPFAMRVEASYDVTGDSLRDRLTRRLSGPRVHMAVTVYSGTLVLVTATFARTTSYGMVFVKPMGPKLTHVRTIVWAPRRRSWLGRALLDPIDIILRRRFIRSFMTDDAVRSQGVDYNPATLIDADTEMRGYLDWLGVLCGAGVSPAEKENS